MTTRCEPPAALRDQDGWHWVKTGLGNIGCFEWEMGRWNIGGHDEPLTPDQLWGWTYISPVASPDDVARLVDILQEVIRCGLPNPALGSDWGAAVEEAHRRIAAVAPFAEVGK